jgi:two-component system OmpR family sensor kinase
MPSRLGRTVNYSGLIVAGTGFFLTRFTVTLAIYEDPMRFYFAGVVPLLLGLGLAAFGVALTVADVEPSVVRTTAGWCLGGVLAMAVLVVLTVLGSNGGTDLTLETVRAENYYSNFLIGGSIGGTLTGLYASRNRRQRLVVERQANRLDVLNRLLRHEVLNSVTLIKGYAGQIGEGDETAARDVIESRSRSIQEVIENVKFLANGSADTDGTASTVDLDDQLARSVDEIQDRYPEAAVDVDAPSGDCTVRATTGLGQVFVQLLENAIVHGNDDSPTVSVTETPTHVRVSVRNEGTDFPENQRSLLETGEIEPFDDPSSGFGLNIVRLFVDDFGGTIETDVGPSETTITIELLRAEQGEERVRPMPTGVSDVRPALPHLVVTLLAAIAAGIGYGAVSEVLGGSVAGIGVFYGTEDVVVGWLTHEFHSVVFGFVFAGLVSIAPRRFRARVGGHVLIGVGWAVVLWAVAAGVVAPVWLRLLGIPARIPSFTMHLLASHLVWGASLGVLTAVGYRFVADRRAPHSP